MAGLGAQRRVDRLPRLICGLFAFSLRRLFGQGVERGQAAGVFQEFCRHFLDGNGEIDQAAGDGAARHVGETRAGTIARLRQDQAALFLDRLDPEKTVMPAAREDDFDGIFAAVLRERGEEHVDGAALGMFRNEFVQAKPPVRNGQAGVGRQHIDMVLLNLLAILSGFDGQLRMAGQDVGEETLAIRGQMGDDDKGHPRIGGNRLEKIFQRAQTACGRADADNREGLVSLHLKNLDNGVAPIPANKRQFCYYCIFYCRCNKPICLMTLIQSAFCEPRDETVA